ncbi:MAG: helix-turn-helix transcriptional regulator [Candidatus Latescibacteria bacterium]|nr:helix-turn-helix transcriptional regulator [Candidatus Latescibacterota bacterium]
MSNSDSQIKKIGAAKSTNAGSRRSDGVGEDIQSDNFRAEFGIRLRSARERMGLTQDEFARLGGVQKLAQLNYEKGERSPSAEYLNNLEPYGVDIHYLMTGIRPSKASPQSIDIELLAIIIAKIEAALARLGPDSPQNFKAKGFAIALLYQALSTIGKKDIRTIEEGAEVAAMGILDDSK